MPFTTGIITNTRDFGTAANTIVVSTKNENTINTATIIIQIFNSVNSTALTPLYVSNFNIGPNTLDVRSFNIAGNVAYEVQLAVSGAAPADVVFSVFGLDGFGNLVTNQRVLQPELTFINALSPTM